MGIDAGRVLCSFEVIDLMRNAGWPAHAIPTGAAVFRAESGWDPRATSYQPNADGSVDKGLVQLNSRYFPDEALAFDPARAVAKALELYNTRKFRPWYAWSNGSYARYLPECEAAADNRPLPYPGKVIVLGAKGVPARTVSFVLRRRGWRCPLTSTYTAEVAEVVRKFQQQKAREGYDLGNPPVDGRVGAKTWGLLFTATVT